MPVHRITLRRIAALKGLLAIAAADCQPEQCEEKTDSEARLTPLDLASRAGELGWPQENTAGMRWTISTVGNAIREHPTQDYTCSRQDLQEAARESGPMRRLLKELESQAAETATTDGELTSAAAGPFRDFRSTSISNLLPPSPGAGPTQPKPNSRLWIGRTRPFGNQADPTANSNHSHTPPPSDTADPKAADQRHDATPPKPATAPAAGNFLDKPLLALLFLTCKSA